MGVNAAAALKTSRLRKHAIDSGRTFHCTMARERMNIV